MRFVITVPTFYIGGITSHALKLSRALRSRGHWTCALVADPFGQLYDQFRERFDQVEIARRGVETRTAYLKRLLKVMLELQPDVLINNMLPFVQAALPSLPASLTRLSVLHSILPDEIRSGTANHACLDWVVAVSRNIASAAQDLVSSAKLVVIPVGLEESASARATASAGAPLEIVYVGRLSRLAKNLPVLAQVVEELHRRGLDFNLTLIGEGDFRLELEKRFAAHPIARRVCFEGALPPSEIAARLLQFDVFLMTSTYEGTPHALLEAMAAGVVPVCSNIKDSTDSLVKHGETGYLCGTNEVEDYVAAIEHLARDAAIRQRLSTAARASARSEFSMSRITDQYLKLASIRQAALPSGQQRADLFRVSIAPELLPHCPGLPRQLRRLSGDLFRAWFRGISPVTSNK